MKTEQLLQSITAMNSRAGTINSHVRETLLECAAYHAKSAKRHRAKRNRMERLNLGPPHSTEHEHKHKRFQNAIRAALAAIPYGAGA